MTLTATSPKIKDPLNHLTTLTYTATGQVQSITDANNHTTTYQYDSQDRLTTLINPDGTTEKYAYNSAGQLTTFTDERSLVTTYAYDPIEPAPRDDRRPGSNQTTLTYDADGDLTTSRLTRWAGSRATPTIRWTGSPP